MAAPLDVLAVSDFCVDLILCGDVRPRFTLIAESRHRLLVSDEVAFIVVVLAFEHYIDFGHKILV